MPPRRAIIKTRLACHAGCLRGRVRGPLGAIDRRAARCAGLPGEFRQEIPHRKLSEQSGHQGRYFPVQEPPALVPGRHPWLFCGCGVQPAGPARI